MSAFRLAPTVVLSDCPGNPISVTFRSVSYRVSSAVACTRWAPGNTSKMPVPTSTPSTVTPVALSPAVTSIDAVAAASSQVGQIPKCVFFLSGTRSNAPL